MTMMARAANGSAPCVSASSGARTLRPTARCRHLKRRRCRPRRCLFACRRGPATFDPRPRERRPPALPTDTGDRRLASGYDQTPEQRDLAFDWRDARMGKRYDHVDPVRERLARPSPFGGRVVQDATQARAPTSKWTHLHKGGQRGSSQERSLATITARDAAMPNVVCVRCDSNAGPLACQSSRPFFGRARSTSTNLAGATVKSSAVKCAIRRRDTGLH